MFTFQKINILKWFFWHRFVAILLSEMKYPINSLAFVEADGSGCDSVDVDVDADANANSNANANTTVQLKFIFLSNSMENSFGTCWMDGQVIWTGFLLFKKIKYSPTFFEIRYFAHTYIHTCSSFLIVDCNIVIATEKRPSR